MPAYGVALEAPQEVEPVPPTKAKRARSSKALARSRLQKDEEDLAKLTVVQLKELLREAGLKVSGRKAELVARLRAQADAAGGAEALRAAEPAPPVEPKRARSSKAPARQRSQKGEGDRQTRRQGRGGPAEPDQQASASEASAVGIRTEGTTVVSTAEEAAVAVKKLRSLVNQFHAIDTETRGWSPEISPYGSAEVTCFSVYCGDAVDFGRGPRLWIDNLDSDGNNRHLVELFREYLEDPKIRKVFHNFAFDRAVFANEGISITGFAGDTMHMARLEHSDRYSYSLEKLGAELLGEEWRKKPFKDLMSEHELGSAEALQLSTKPGVREAWVDYSTFDTVVTWKLHDHLAGALRSMQWNERGSMLDFYSQFWRPFAEVLADIEARGMPVDAERLQEQECRARRDLERHHVAFLDWVQKEYLSRYPGAAELEGAAEALNPNSPKQVQHLLFGQGITTVASVPIGGLGLPSAVLGRQSVAGDVIRRLAGHSPESGEEGCGMALEHLGQDGCVGLHMYSRTKEIAKAISAFLEPLQAFVDEHGRVRSSLNIMTTTGRLTCSRPNMQQLPGPGKDPYGVRDAVRCADDRRFIVADYGQLDLRVLAHMTGCERLIEAICSGTDIHSATAFNMYPHIQLAVQRGDVSLDGASNGSTPLLKNVFRFERRCGKAVNFGIAYGLTAQGLARQLNCTKKEGQGMIDSWYQAYPGVQRWQDDVVAEAEREAARTGEEAYVTTLRGRRRRLAGFVRKDPPHGDGPDEHITEKEFREQAREERWQRIVARRQATNSPIQGGAADIVVEAMLKAHWCEELRGLGFTMVMQIHDELVFEGPAGNATAALAVVKDIMEHPFLDGSELKVPLPVDARIARTWADGT